MDELLKQWIPNVMAYKGRFFTSLSQTMQMTLRSGAIALVVGLALGVLLTVTKKDGIRPQAVIYRIVDLFVNLFRSIPFIILLIFLIPFTRMLVGTAIGVKGALVPLVFGCVPFYTRQVEAALASVDGGKVEAARSMGSSTLGIIFRVYLHEAVPDLIRATTITAISLIGLTTMAGAVGAGGIGSFAINYGQNQNHQDIVNVCVIILLLFVSLLQFAGNLLARRTTNRGLLRREGKDKA
ncbi:MAG: ABC transporter permease [Clostridia bacterium]|nr:ABC transporter permease [Clostridia bacterium]